jgi:phage terminase large subunit-like protein
MQFNPRWSEVFGLYKGDKWAEGEIEFRHEIEGHSVFVTAAGITGSIRGINFEDYRPDLIICDDIIDRESVSTAAARKKITELVHGDIKESLEAASDNPNAKLILLETPLSADDPGEQAKRDPLWATFEFSCWTPETKNLDVDQQVSSWPARYPTQMLREEKKAAALTNRLYIFIREKEIKLVSPETASFAEEWIQSYDVSPPLEEMERVMWVDPVPPPSPKQVAEGLAKKDYEAFVVVGKHKDTGRFYCLESRTNRGHQPDWSIKAFFELVLKWRPRAVYVEAVAYQRTLASLFEMAMRSRRMFVTVYPVSGDRRSKLDKVTDGLHGPLSNRMVYIRPEMTTLRAQIVAHPDIEHDDEIECLSSAIEKLNFGYTAEDYNELLKEEDQLPALGDWRMNIDERVA